MEAVNSKNEDKEFSRNIWIIYSTCSTMRVENNPLIKGFAIFLKELYRLEKQKKVQFYVIVRKEKVSLLKN